MIENLSLKIARSVIPENEASGSNIAIISYGVQAIISTLATLLLSLFVAIFFSNNIFELLLFSITFIPIRLLHKGYHCKTFFGCVITSNIMLVCATYLANIIPIKFCLSCLPILLFIEYWASVEKKKGYVIFEATYIFILSILYEGFIIFSFLTLLISNILIIGGKCHGSCIIFKKRNI